MAGLRKILLVEDNPQIQEIYSVTLSTADYEVEVAEEGESALKKVVDFQPDLILLDIMLPGMSGLEILTKLRTDSQYGSEDTKIVILTNLGHDERVEDAWQNMADGYVVKSEIQTNDIFDVIKSLERPGESPEEVTQHDTAPTERNQGVTDAE